MKNEKALDEINRTKRDTGTVYSQQIAAQLTALSAKITFNTQHLFSEATHQICTSLQSIVDQTLSLAITNPTLLARHFMKNKLISARLVTDRTLEIKPCFPINYNWKINHCFNRYQLVLNFLRSKNTDF